MTEDEAKTKWCPMVRYVVLPDENRLENNRDTIFHGNHCIGSACMMWHWIVPPNEVKHDAGNGHEPLKLVPSGRAADGCCGLAGKP